MRCSSGSSVGKRVCLFGLAAACCNLYCGLFCLFNFLFRKSQTELTNSVKGIGPLAINRPLALYRPTDIVLWNRDYEE